MLQFLLRDASDSNFKSRKLSSSSSSSSSIFRSPIFMQGTRGVDDNERTVKTPFNSLLQGRQVGHNITSYVYFPFLLLATSWPTLRYSTVSKCLVTVLLLTNTALYTEPRQKTKEKRKMHTKIFRSSSKEGGGAQCIEKGRQEDKFVQNVNSYFLTHSTFLAWVVITSCNCLDLIYFNISKGKI